MIRKRQILGFCIFLAGAFIATSRPGVFIGSPDTALVVAGFGCVYIGFVMWYDTWRRDIIFKHITNWIAPQQKRTEEEKWGRLLVR